MNKPTWIEVACFYACAIPMLALLAWMVINPVSFTATLAKIADYVFRMLA